MKCPMHNIIVQTRMGNDKLPGYRSTGWILGICKLRRMQLPPRRMEYALVPGWTDISLGE